MFVVKRNGQQEPVSFNAIYERVAGFCEGLDAIVDPVVMALNQLGVFAARPLPSGHM